MDTAENTIMKTLVRPFVPEVIDYPERLSFAKFVADASQTGNACSCSKKKEPVDLDEVYRLADESSPFPKPVSE